MKPPMSCCTVGPDKLERMVEEEVLWRARPGKGIPLNGGAALCRPKEPMTWLAIKLDIINNEVAL